MSELNKFLMTDIEEIPVADVSSLEKKAMKKRLLGQKRKMPWLKKLVVSAIIVLTASTTTVMAFPSLAAQIPVLKDIVSYFNEDQFILKDFDEMAESVALTQTSNGSTLTIEEAVYDGMSVTISFALETEMDLGDSPLPHEFLKIAGVDGPSSSLQMNKINETAYVGIITMNLDLETQSAKNLEVTWEPSAFQDLDSGNELYGDWSFAFKLKALDGNSTPVNFSFDFEGGTYTVKELLQTKLSTVLVIGKQNLDGDPIVHWQLEDNLGKTYMMQSGLGGTPYQQFMFEALDSEATSVTITPLTNPFEKIEIPGEGTPSVTVDLK
ncbi:DUF4179 domain-containing protein [Planococcus shixiaomingii]|uniref:DUF4179 domain-containing protein n=1 Tax=Planococcus shixiaomingii TaxID=3058393 RepID=UPI00261F38D6|nr:DUF4179 domain-containing protein [Planococcus sp. N022]WKA55593.1 DUF4179 domain-containing protein [Planococcus sp. N022]